MNPGRWLAVAVLLVGCTEKQASDLGRQEQNMGMGGFGGGAVDSPLADPSAILLAEYRTPSMRAPTRVAVSATGGIVVSDPAAGRVHVLTPHGKPRFFLDVEKPLGVAVGPDGRIYVGDELTGAVRVYSERGRLESTLGAGVGEFQMPNDIAFEPTRGYLHVVDSKARAVKVYGAGGSKVFEYGSEGTAAGQFRFPVGITASTTGKLFVSDPTAASVSVFDAGGTYLTRFGSFGATEGQLTRPHGMAFDAVGRLYVVDVFQGRLQVLDDQGRHVSWLGRFGNLRGQLALPMDAFLDSYNRLVVTSSDTGKLVVMGIEPFSDPPEPVDALAAEVTLEPNPLSIRSRGRWIGVHVEVPEDTAENLEPMSVIVDGVPLDFDAPAVLGDWDADGVPDLGVRLPRAAFIAELGGPGDHTVPFEASLRSGTPVTAEVKVTLLGREDE